MQMACLLIGAMMPYSFSALTMNSVGEAASEMCEVVTKQILIQNEHPEDLTLQKYLDYKECIAVSTKASLREMILPGVLVICTPLVLGILFGELALAAYLAGVIVSGVQMAVSSSNSGGAWDNAKKFIEAGRLKNSEKENKKESEKQDIELADVPQLHIKGSDAHKSAVVGDTVGDPLKDTSGPSLNILIKLSSIVSLIFATFIKKHALFNIEAKPVGK